MEQIQHIIDSVASWLWGWPMIILLIGTHIYLTLRLRLPQRKILTAIKLSFQKEDRESGDISPFGSLATSLAATIGTGNIIGVATAVSLGGPGAVFWCWVTGVLGIATKYAEGVLAVKYRVKTENGEMIGGPMYALERGLNMRWLAVLFCIFTAIAAFGIGNTVQANSIATLLNETLNVPTYITGAIIALLVAMVNFFGIKGIARVCVILVPFMALFYLLGCAIILCMNAQYLGTALKAIIESAFSSQAASGGFAGSTIMIAARYGIARGLFSNESGLGSAPIIAAAARTRNPVRQALISSSATFWDTVVICAITGLTLVSSIIAHPDIDCAQGAVLTNSAFSKIPYAGEAILTVGIFTFAFSTLLSWSYYGEKAIEYLGGKKCTKYYRIAWVIVVFIGSVMNLSLVWGISDCMNALMAIPNLVALLLLSGIVAKETKKYLWSGKLDEYDDNKQ